MDFIPKLADIKFLQEMSKVVITPMLIAAYLIQSDFTLFGVSVNSNGSIFLQAIQFIGIFLCTCGLVGFLIWLVNDILVLMHIYTNSIALPILATIFISFGFVGVYGATLPLLINLNHMWFYTAFVAGFYMLAKKAEIDSI